MVNTASHLALLNITEASEKLQMETKRIIEERNALDKERQQWEENKKLLREKSAFGKNVLLDVGGIHYRVSIMTLTQGVPKSRMLSSMFSGLFPPEKTQETFFIDRNGRIFEHILEYLRVGFPSLSRLRLLGEPQRSITLHEIHEEAKFFDIPDLINDIYILTACFKLANLKDLLLPVTLTAKGGLSNPAYSGATKIDYGEEKGNNIEINNCYAFEFRYQKVRSAYGPVIMGICLCEGSYFHYCDLSGVIFKNCYFAPKTDFTGSIMCGVCFEKCGGLVENKICFSRKQLCESGVDDTLADALRKADCIQEELVKVSTS